MNLLGSVLFCFGLLALVSAWETGYDGRPLVCPVNVYRDWCYYAGLREGWVVVRTIDHIGRGSVFTISAEPEAVCLPEDEELTRLTNDRLQRLEDDLEKQKRLHECLIWIVEGMHSFGPLLLVIYAMIRCRMTL